MPTQTSHRHVSTFFPHNFNRKRFRHSSTTLSISYLLLTLGLASLVLDSGGCAIPRLRTHLESPFVGPATAQSAIFWKKGGSPPTPRAGAKKKTQSESIERKYLRFLNLASWQSPASFTDVFVGRIFTQHLSIKIMAFKNFSRNVKSQKKQNQFINFQFQEMLKNFDVNTFQ